MLEYSGNIFGDTPFDNNITAACILTTAWTGLDLTKIGQEWVGLGGTTFPMFSPSHANFHSSSFSATHVCVTIMINLLDTMFSSCSSCKFGVAKQKRVSILLNKPDIYLYF